MVDLIPNGVDLDLFRTPQSRPATLPPSPVAVYVGTLHDERIDVALLEELAAARPDLHIALVGPDCLGAESSARLAARPLRLLRLGAQPYERVPAFLQRADVVLVPHQVNPFTESLDPIKAYECVAAGRPTVATPVAGFRGLGGPVVVRDRSGFVDAVVAVVDAAPAATPTGSGRPEVASLAGSGPKAMGDVMARVRTRRRPTVRSLLPTDRRVPRTVDAHPYPCSRPCPPKASPR